MVRHVDVDWIVAEYGSGRSAQALARELLVDVSVVTSRLKRRGVALRDSRAATVANLARDPSILSGMGRPRVCSVDESFFDEITPSSAYVCGLLHADGHIDRGTRIRLTLKESDGGHVRSVADAMGVTGSIRRVRAKLGVGITLEINSRRLAQAALARNVKTAVSAEFADDRDYWRGVVDGDGTLCNTSAGRRILALVGAKTTCAAFLAFCQRRGVGLRTSVYPHRSIFTARVSGVESARIATVLYQPADALALPRKRSIAETWRQEIML